MLSDKQVSNLRGILRKPHVNSTCIGCAACTAISGDVFVFDDDGLSCVQSLTDYENRDVDDSIAACPVNAISWQDTNPDGSYKNGVTEHIDV